MVDKQKRNTIKTLGATAIATAAASHAAWASSASSLNTAAVSDLSATGDGELAKISVYTRVSSASNDIEVVIQNTGAEDALITQITPSQTVTRRGTFDFSQLLDKGDVQLKAGQSIRVPMTPRTVVLDASTSATQRAQSLSDALRRSFSVITDHEAFARVEVSENVRFA